MAHGSVPANHSPMPSGPRDQAVSTRDVIAVLSCVRTYDGDDGSQSPNGVTYDSEKIDIGTKAGRDDDRSPSPLPNPPWDASPPDGAVTMQDVLVALTQVGLDCRGAP